MRKGSKVLLMHRTVSVPARKPTPRKMQAVNTIYKCKYKYKYKYKYIYIYNIKI